MCDNACNFDDLNAVRGHSVKKYESKYTCVLIHVQLNYSEQKLVGASCCQAAITLDVIQYEQHDG